MEFINKNIGKFDVEKLENLPSKLKEKIEIPEKFCLICYEDLSGDEDGVELECGHNKFHFACLEQWKESSRNKNCPVCRANLV